MPEVSAVSVSPTCAVPLMVGCPVAGLLGRASTVPVAALVNSSSLPAPSVKDTRTLTVLPSSLSVKGVCSCRRPGDVRPVGQPLVLVANAAQAVRVFDRRGVRRQRLTHLAPFRRWRALR